MRKVLFILSFGLALNCHAADATGDAAQNASNEGFFSGMQDIYDKMVHIYRGKPDSATATESSPDTSPSPAQTSETQSTPNTQLSGNQAALNALNNYDYVKAIYLYQQVLDNDPNNRGANLGLAKAYLLQGNYTAGGKQLAVYKSKFGEDKPYLIEKARYFAFTDKNQEAENIIDGLLKNDPSNDTLLDIKEFIQKENAKHASEQQTDTVQTAQGSDTAPTAMSSQNYGQAIKQYQEQIKQNPDDKEAQIGLIRAVLLKGGDRNYRYANQLLNKYEQKNGVDDAYSTERARYYAFTGQPSKSLATLQPLLDKNPNDPTLLSIQDYAKSRPATGGTGGSVHTGPSAATLGRRADANGHSSAAYSAAADAYSAEGNDEKALEMINKAVDVDPTNSQLLLKRAQIANSRDDQLTVYNSYLALYATNPDNKTVILGLARAASRLGKTDQANYLYSVYTTRYPNERDPWIEYAYNESWSGNDRGAIAILNHYQALFGPNDMYWIARSRIVATAVRPRTALCIINSMLPKYPNNYDLNYANVIALFYNNQPVEMFQALAKLNRLQPGTEETEGLNAFVWTPYRNNINLDLYDSFDSDTVKIARATVFGQQYLDPLTFLIGNVTAERLSASVNSGLNPIEGGNAIKLTTFNVGINHRFNPVVALQGIVGGGHANNDENAMLYQGNAFLNFNDFATADLMIKRGFYDESARSVSRGVKQNLYQALFNFMPCTQCYINATGAYATFTDNNTMRFAELNPSANIIATERWNIRVGVDGQWYKFGRHTNNGYYDPFNYLYYGVVTDIYLKQSENIGYVFSVGLGTQRDETFTTYTAANDFGGKAYLGLFQDWMLVLSAGASTRGRSIADNPTVGSYRVYNFGATITRRL